MEAIPSPLLQRSMSAITASCHLQPHKPIHEISGKRLGFWGELDWKKSVRCCARMTHNISSSYDGIRFSAANKTEEGGDNGSSGFESSLNTLSKWIVSAATTAIIIWRHDAAALWAATGAVLNTILSVTLKRTLNRKRPASALRSDPGMPSSHAQTIFYMIAFLNLSLVEWYGMNTMTTILSGIMVVVGSYFSWLRFSQEVHTLGQVMVGCIVGSIFSIWWFWLWYTRVCGLFVSLFWVRIGVTLGALVYALCYLHYVCVHLFSM